MVEETNMPFFDYECAECNYLQTDVWVQNHAVEVNRKRECPYCKDAMMSRKPSAPAFSVTGFSAANGYSGGK